MLEEVHLAVKEKGEVVLHGQVNHVLNRGDSHGAGVSVAPAADGVVEGEEPSPAPLVVPAVNEAEEAVLVALVGGGSGKSAHLNVGHGIVVRRLFIRHKSLLFREKFSMPIYSERNSIFGNDEGKFS